MQVLVTGGTGFIGSALLPALCQAGYSPVVLTRQNLGDAGGVRYINDLTELPDNTDIHAIINLAGASLAARRWSKAYKKELVESRLGTTRAVVDFIRRQNRAPGRLLSASAIGYYGHHGDEELDENGSIRPGFAQSLCVRWEEAAQAAVDFGTSTCLMRLGVVLDRDGGAFEQMARPFRLGVANYVGDGNQWLSWIHRHDVVSAILFLLDNRIEGPVNLTAPRAVTHRQFCAAMQRRQRTFLTLPMPAPVMHLMLGEMAEELLLNGQRVVPGVLSRNAFEFRYPDIDTALAAIIGN